MSRGLWVGNPFFLVSRGKWRVIVGGGPQGRRRCRQFDSEEEALKYRRAVAREIEAAQNLTIGAALADWYQFRNSLGCRLSTVATCRIGLELMFPAEPISAIGYRGRDRTPLTWVDRKTLSALYDRLRGVTSKVTDKPLAATTHRTILTNVKSLLAWACDRDHFTPEQLARCRVVKGVGICRKGKKQLRIDEARQYVRAGIQLASEGDLQTQRRAIAGLLPLMVGMRTSEIVSRQVRDVDDGGRRICVDENDSFDPKTGPSRRSIPVPKRLQPLLLRLSLGRNPTDWLFGERRTRMWVVLCVRFVTKAAGTPRVSPHGLRGTLESLASSGGALYDQIEPQLGHTEKVGRAHYATVESQRAGDITRGESVLEGEDE